MRKQMNEIFGHVFFFVDFYHHKNWPNLAGLLWEECSAAELSLGQFGRGAAEDGNLVPFCRAIWRIFTQDLVALGMRSDERIGCYKAISVGCYGCMRETWKICCLRPRLTRNCQGYSVHTHHETWGCHVNQIVLAICGHYRIRFW